MSMTTGFPERAGEPWHTKSCSTTTYKIPVLPFGGTQFKESIER